MKTSNLWKNIQQKYQFEISMFFFGWNIPNASFYAYKSEQCIFKLIYSFGVAQIANICIFRSNCGLMFVLYLDGIWMETIQWVKWFANKILTSIGAFYCSVTLEEWNHFTREKKRSQTPLSSTRNMQAIRHLHSKII